MTTPGSGGSIFIETATARVSWRPLRLAYLVRYGNRQDLRDAIEYASTEFGGISHPILPISPRRKLDGLYAQIAEMLRPDYLLNLAGAPMGTIERVAATIGAQPVFGRETQFGLHPLALKSAEALVARTVFVPRRHSALGELVALGNIPQAQFQEWKDDVGSIWPVADPVDLLEGQLEVPSPIGITRSGTATVRHSAWFGSPVIVDVHPMKPRRAYYFWNLRATAVPGLNGVPTRMIWLPEAALEDPRIQERLRVACLQSVTDPDLVLNGPNPEHLRAVAKAMGFVELPGTATKERLLLGNPARDLQTRPLHFRVNVHPAPFLFGDRTYGIAQSLPIPVTGPKTVFHSDSPYAMRPRHGGYLRVGVGEVDQLRWPPKAAVARLIEPNASYRDDSLGFVVQTSDRGFTFSLKVPEASAIVEAILGERGATWALSDKGRYATALGSAAGTYSGLLSDEDTLRFASALASLSRRKAHQLLQRLRLPEADPERIAAIERVLAQGRRWRRLGEVAGELGATKRSLLPVANGLLEAGLLNRALPLSCRSCGMVSFIELAAADDWVSCPACKSRQTLIGSDGAEPEFAYGLNALLDRALDQDCVSHLLAELYVRRVSAVVWSVPGALISLSGGVAREIDLLAMSHDRLIMGELKSKPTDFRPTYVRDLARLAVEIGAGELLLGTTSNWDAAEKETVEKAVGPLIRITTAARADLFASST
jgi:hypothetical protein